MTLNGHCTLCFKMHASFGANHGNWINTTLRSLLRQQGILGVVVICLLIVINFELKDVKTLKWLFIYWVLEMSALCFYTRDQSFVEALERLRSVLLGKWNYPRLSAKWPIAYSSILRLRLQLVEFLRHGWPHAIFWVIFTQYSSSFNTPCNFDVISMPVVYT